MSVAAYPSTTSSRADRLERTDRTLANLLETRATDEGTIFTPFSNMCFYRVSRPTRFHKTPVVGPRFIAIAQGRKVAHFPEGDLSYEEGDFLLVTNETSFEGTVSEVSPERPYLAMCMELAPDIIARTLLALADDERPGRTGRELPSAAALRPPSKVKPVLPAFVSKLDAGITSTLARLLLALDEPLERKVVAPLALEELVFRLLRTDAAAILRSAVRDGDESIQVAMTFIRENAARPLTVERVARHVGMSASHFAHRFTEVARVSPMRFVKHVRLDTARTLLVTSGVRVSEAASRVGYESASHFTRDFKQTYGSSPAEYARRIRQ